MRRKILSLLIFVIILSVYPLHTAADITHVEQDYGPKAIARVYRTDVFDDNTIVLRLIRRNITASTPTRLVTFNVFSLRIINPDGTVVEKDINLDIQSFNYNVDLVTGGAIIYLNYNLIRKNHILVTYFNATDVNDLNTYEERAMIIDFDGKKYDDVLFGPLFLDERTGNLRADRASRLKLNVNREKGFIVLSNIRGDDGLTGWQQFKVEPDGKFTKLTSGRVEFRSQIVLGTNLATIDEGYALVYANTSINTNVATDPLSAQGQIAMVPIGYNQSAGSPLILYQTPLQNITLGDLTCNVAFAGIGQTCILYITQTGRKTFIKVDFLSTGSVISTNFFDDPFAPPNATGNYWEAYGLQYGGFLLINTVQAETFKKGLNGYLYDQTNNAIKAWDYPEPVLSNVEGVNILLPNNTLMVAQFEENNTWQLLALDLPRFDGGKDKGYSNVHVEDTYPKINAIISPKIPTQISINFYDPVVLSNGQLSIYQMTDGQPPILRQRIPANTGFSIGNDSRTVSADVLESTFSISNGNYFIKVDNEFVREMSFNEPLLGIKDNMWIFTTEGVTDNFAPDSAGLLRLTPNGTRAFDDFSPEQQHNFFEDLRNEIAIAVPVNRERLTTNGNVQLEKGVNEKQYLVSIGILETRTDYENSVATIIRLINVMIKNQDQSPIGFGRVAGFLDEEYGFVRSPDLWEQYRTRLIGLFVVVAIFFILLFFAHKKHGEGNNIAILRLGVILFDLIMDILFVSTNSKDVPVLYIPSVVFITLPIAINTTLAFYIISEESKKPEFYQWFRRNGNVASIFTVLAGADIEALTILESNMAGFKFFRAPFSKSAETMIFWGAFLNIFTEDIPQVIIQVYYRRKTVAYDIIPLLTLISSSVNLVINIVGRLYQATNRMRNLNVSKYKTPNDEDFGGLEVVTTERTVQESAKTDEKPEKLDEKTGEKTDVETDEKTDVETDEKTDVETDEKTR